MWMPLLVRVPVAVRFRPGSVVWRTKAGWTCQLRSTSPPGSGPTGSSNDFAPSRKVSVERPSWLIPAGSGIQGGRAGGSKSRVGSVADCGWDWVLWVTDVGRVPGLWDLIACLNSHTTRSNGEAWQRLQRLTPSPVVCVCRCQDCRFRPSVMGLHVHTLCFSTFFFHYICWTWG